MNVRLLKSESQTRFGQRLLDAKELEIFPVDGGAFFGGVLEGARKDRDFGAFDVLREVWIRAFGTDAAFFAEDNLGRILDLVEHAVEAFLCDIVDGHRSAGVVGVTAAPITSRGRKKWCIGSLDVVAEEAEFLDKRNEGMESILLTADSDSAADVGEGGPAGNAIVRNSGAAPVGLTSIGIALDGAEGFDMAHFVEIAGQVENKERDGIATRGADDGIGIGRNGSDKREIDDGCDRLREAVADRFVVVDAGKLGMELITGEPAGFFLGKRFGVGPVDGPASQK